MADHYFIFNGIDTREYGFIVTGDTPYAVNAYSYDVQNVDGRDGDIIYSHERHGNIDVTYSLAVKGNGAYGFRSKFEAFRRLISAAEGYCTLIDSYNPGYIRYGYLKATVYPTQAGVSWSSGKVSITFSCKPQMYLEEGTQYKTYPFLMRGRCYTTGLIDSSGDSSRRRAGPFEFGNSGYVYMRLINGSTDLSVVVTQVDTNEATWTDCSQETITLPASGEWVSVSQGYDYFWFQFINSDISGNTYIETSFDMDAIEYRCCSNGIAILNDTQFNAKPQFNLIATDDSKGSWFFAFYAYSATDEDNRIWIKSHTDADGDNFCFDSEKQTVVNEAGTSMSRYVKMVVDEDDTIFSQNFPIIYPGINLISGYWGWDATKLPPYKLQIKTNIWTV